MGHINLPVPLNILQIFSNNGGNGYEKSVYWLKVTVGDKQRIIKVDINMKKGFLYSLLISNFKLFFLNIWNEKMKIKAIMIPSPRYPFPSYWKILVTGKTLIKRKMSWKELNNAFIFDWAALNKPAGLDAEEE